MTEMNGLRTSRIAAFVYNLIECYLLPRIEKVVKGPDQLTMIGSAVALLVPVGFYLHPAIGLVIMLISAAADMTDGLWAKKIGKTTRYGAFLDSCMDRVSDGFYLIGFATLLFGSGHKDLGFFLIFIAYILTVMISYIKARAEALGIRCNVGIAERGTRCLFLLFWALLLVFFSGPDSVVFWGGLIIYLLFTFVTVIQRILFVRSAFLNLSAQ